MAWNEPGSGSGGNGGKDNNPWGSGGRKGSNGDQGPPDLDEALRNLQQKLGKIFGGGGNSGNDSSGSTGAGGLISMAVVIAAVIWGASGFYTVDQQERGVVLRFGSVQDVVVQPGLHWNPPLIDRVHKVNVTKVNSRNYRNLMLTEDENIVDVAMSVQYRISDPKKNLLAVKDPNISLDHAAESALRHVVGSSEMDQVLTQGRAQLAADVQIRLQNYMDDYNTGIDVSKVNIEDSQPPREVQEAFDDVIKAKEDEQREKNQAEAYANKVVPEARGHAQRQIEEANAYKEQVIAKAQGETARFEKLLTEYQKAPGVTRQRLYIDALQTVMSNSSKILIDVEGGNNMLYLPLDKLMNQAPSVTASRVKAGNLSSQELRTITDQVIQQINSRSAALKRGGR